MSIDTTVSSLEAVNRRLMAIHEELPADGEGILTGELSTRLLARGIELQGLRLMDALRYLEAHGLVKPNQNQTRWRHKS